ncbi:MAG: cob(I)yrinic acid a,c-diamide adenosyltransferase [bacterium]|nr:cob(I)yrinic acid a,c-diamide adenosyltransferase [bacterium]MDI1336622.1 cob(I)yrinic acid a,c-diamide adenosyltransferase [Lacunisphaera sp.]
MPADPKSPARSIATRTGDDGTTALLYGQRVPKNHPQVEAVGALDELNAALGFAKATRPAGADAAELERIQHELVALMGEVGCAEADATRYADSKFAKLGDPALARIDTAVAAVEARQPKFDGWATPGANLHAAALDLARTAARRAERQLVGLKAHGKTIRPLLLQYVNRVSDLLWLMAREAENT